MTQRLEVVFIGGGNMAHALLAGLIAGGATAARIGVVEPDDARRRQLAERFGVCTEARAASLVPRADTLVLAVKPQVLAEVARELGALLQAPAPLVVSIAAGVRLTDLRRWLGRELPLVRCMPNTPALVRAGVTALYAPPGVSKADRERAAQVLAAVGETSWVSDEAALDAVTAVSGSGPAYFFLLMEALEQAGTALGLEPATARTLAVQTARGAGLLAAAQGSDPAELRRQVTSPGGTTQAALEVLRTEGFEALVARAVAAAQARSVELADRAGAQ